MNMRSVYIVDGSACDLVVEEVAFWNVGAVSEDELSEILCILDDAEV